MKELEAAFGAPVIESYGMTEASHQMCSNPLPPRPRKPGIVGLAAGPEVAIMDDDGTMLPQGEIGEVVIRGPNVTPGYEANPEANAKAFTNGWFRTGDQGMLDAEGYLLLTGRLKELIKRGGEQVSPLEVDGDPVRAPGGGAGADLRHPASDAGRGGGRRRRCCATAWQCTERELRDFAAQHLADFKVPRKVVFLAEIPKGATGKLMRIGLAEKLGIWPEARSDEDLHLRRRRDRRPAWRRSWRPRARRRSPSSPAARIWRPCRRTGLKLRQRGRGDRGASALRRHRRRGRAAGLRRRDAEGACAARRAPQMQPLLGPETAIVSAVNGMPWWYFYKLARPVRGAARGQRRSRRPLWELLHPSRAIGCIVYPAAEVAEPGVIDHTYGDRFTLGEPDGSRSPRANALSAALVAAGFKAPVRPKIRDEMWVKLWGNLAFNPLSALTGATLDVITGEPGTARASAAP